MGSSLFLLLLCVCAWSVLVRGVFAASLRLSAAIMGRPLPQNTTHRHHISSRYINMAFQFQVDQVKERNTQVDSMNKYLSKDVIASS